MNHIIIYVTKHNKLSLHFKEINHILQNVQNIFLTINTNLHF